MTSAIPTNRYRRLRPCAFLHLSFGQPGHSLCHFGLSLEVTDGSSGDSGLLPLFGRRSTTASTAGSSYLLVSKGSTKTIRMSLSRERRSAALKRAPSRVCGAKECAASTVAARQSKLCSRLLDVVASKPAPFFNAPPSLRSFSAACDNAEAQNNTPDNDATPTFPG